MALSKNQRRVLDFVVGYASQAGHAPTMREIAAGLDLAVSTIQWHVTKLHELGAIRRHPGSPRTIVVIRRAS